MIFIYAVVPKMCIHNADAHIISFVLIKNRVKHKACNHRVCFQLCIFSLFILKKKYNCVWVKMCVY